MHYFERPSFVYVKFVTSLLKIESIFEELSNITLSNSPEYEFDVL